MLINIKLLVHYQVRQESYLFFFKKGREQMTNESKSNEFVSNFFLLKKTKRKHMRLKDEYKFVKT